MTSPYVDTGLLVKLYVPEPDSPMAVRLVHGFPPPLPLTDWQEVELRTALRLKAFRQENDPARLQSSLNDFASDISAGRGERPDYLHSDVFERAESLSRGFAALLGCRTLDILDVAAALAIGARDFLTSDMRQARLAREFGLNVRSL